MHHSQNVGETFTGTFSSPISFYAISDSQHFCDEGILSFYCSMHIPEIESIQVFPCGQTPWCGISRKFDDETDNCDGILGPTLEHQ